MSISLILTRTIIKFSRNRPSQNKDKVWSNQLWLILMKMLSIVRIRKVRNYCSYWEYKTRQYQNMFRNILKNSDRIVKNRKALKVKSKIALMAKTMNIWWWRQRSWRMLKTKMKNKHFMIFSNELFIVKFYLFLILI